MKTTLNIHADSRDIPSVTIRRLRSGTFSIVIEIGTDEVTLFLNRQQVCLLSDRMGDAVISAEIKD